MIGTEMTIPVTPGTPRAATSPTAAGSGAADRAESGLGQRPVPAGVQLVERNPGGVQLGLGLGLLAKGPLTLILAGLPIGLWALLEWRWRALWRGLPWIRGSLLMLLVAAPWYLLAELKTPGVSTTTVGSSSYVAR